MAAKKKSSGSSRSPWVLIGAAVVMLGLLGVLWLALARVQNLQTVLPRPKADTGNKCSDSRQDYTCGCSNDSGWSWSQNNKPAGAACFYDEECRSQNCESDLTICKIGKCAAGSGSSGGGGGQQSGTSSLTADLCNQVCTQLGASNQYCTACKAGLQAHGGSGGASSGNQSCFDNCYANIKPGNGSYCQSYCAGGGSGTGGQSSSACFDNCYANIKPGNGTYCRNYCASGGSTTGAATNQSCFDSCFSKTGNGSGCRAACANSNSCFDACVTRTGHYTSCITECSSATAGSCYVNSDCSSGQTCGSDHKCSSNSTGSSATNACWGNMGNNASCYDCNGDKVINILDFSCFAKHWLENIQ